MNKETYEKIKKYIFNEHEHHAYDEETKDGYPSNCVDSSAPYLNSLALENFIDSLANPKDVKEYKYE